MATGVDIAAGPDIPTDVPVQFGFLPVAIPGAKSVEQATANAVAGDDELSEAELERLRV